MKSLQFKALLLVLLILHQPSVSADDVPNQPSINADDPPNQPPVTPTLSTNTTNTTDEDPRYNTLALAAAAVQIASGIVGLYKDCQCRPFSTDTGPIREAYNRNSATTNAQVHGG